MVLINKHNGNIELNKAFDLEESSSTDNLLDKMIGSND